MLESAQEILAIALPAFTVLLIGFLFKLAYAWTKLIEDQRMQAIVRMLVRAAEQEYGPQSAGDKYDYVVEGLNERHANTGRAAIEAEVYEINREAPAV